MPIIPKSLIKPQNDIIVNMGSNQRYNRVVPKKKTKTKSTTKKRKKKKTVVTKTINFLTEINNERLREEERMRTTKMINIEN